MGPLSGIRIIEIASIGPSPMCAMLLADLGATVLRVERLEPSELGIRKPRQFDTVMRNRQIVRADLKNADHRDWLLGLINQSEVLLEGFRPGVMERLGLGPEQCLAINPSLIYGRMTGWGQSGPLSQSAGHDLNYIAITGVLHAIGRQHAPPTPPLNLVGDYGGGSLYLAVGVLSGLLEARCSGKGQVVDAAIIDGASSLMAPFYGLHAAGIQNQERGDNILDSGRYYYDVYECSDGRWISVAAIEKKFRIQLLQLMEIELPTDAISEYAESPALRVALTDRFREKPLAHWCEVLGGTDACVAPVLTLQEAGQHPQLKARNTLIEVDGVTQPAPAPRFSRTPPAKPTAPYAKILSRDEATSLWNDRNGPQV